MARVYGRIESTFWKKEKARGWSREARMAYLYLCSCQHGNASGAFHLPAVYATHDVQFSMDEWGGAELELIQSGSIEREGEYIRIVGWFQHNRPDNKATGKSMARSIRELPDGSLKLNAVRELLEADFESLSEEKQSLIDLEKALSERLAKHSRTVSANTDTEPDTDTEEFMPSDGDAAPRPKPPKPKKNPQTDEQFNLFWQAYPRRRVGKTLVRGSKQRAYALWLKFPDDKKLKATSGLDPLKQATPDGSEYVPDAEKYLRNESWNDYETNVIPLEERGYTKWGRK